MTEPLALKTIHRLVLVYFESCTYTLVCLLFLRTALTMRDNINVHSLSIMYGTQKSVKAADRSRHIVCHRHVAAGLLLLYTALRAVVASEEDKPKQI